MKKKNVLIPLLGGINTTTAEDIYPSRLGKGSFFVVSSVGYNTTKTY